MRRYVLSSVIVLIFVVIAGYEPAAEYVKADTCYPPSLAYMWSWRQPPYAIVYSYGYPYVYPGVSVVARDPIHYDTIYVGTSNSGLCCGYVAPQDGIYRSPDKGRTWYYLSKVDPDQVVTQIVIHPITSTIIFAGFQQNYPTDTGGVYRSFDGGENWESVLPNIAVHDIEIAPTDPNRIYVSGAPATAPWGIYRSTNAGQTWERISDQWLNDLAVHPITPTTLFGTLGDIYRSDDAGATWTLIANLGQQGPDSQILIDPQNSSRMFAYGGWYNGIWKTENEGQSWNSVVSNLPDVGFGLTIQSAAIDPVDHNTIWIGLKYSGMFVSFDGANTWNEFTTGLPFVGRSIYGPQCTTIALAVDGTHAVACDGRFYTRELAHFQFLPFVAR